MKLCGNIKGNIFPRTCLKLNFTRHSWKLDETNNSSQSFIARKNEALKVLLQEKKRSFESSIVMNIFETLKAPFNFFYKASKAPLQVNFWKLVGLIFKTNMTRHRAALFTGSTRELKTKISACFGYEFPGVGRVRGNNKQYLW